MLQTHYTILEVDKNASSREIERAYRRMVRLWHPDLNQGDMTARERFQMIQAAFDVLHNADKRLEYDRSFQHPIGNTEVFEEAGVAKPGEPIVTVANEHDLDHIRFKGRLPGTAIQIYKPRSRWVSLTDWLTSSDFVLPMVLLAIFLGIQFASMLVDVIQRMQ
ncbi:MAG: J domain-containing protein [Pirellulales bacterium]|nr:J domain-containing protein [Pirellulales bacterium]